MAEGVRPACICETGGMYEDFLPADAFTFDRAYMTLSCDAQTQALTVHGIAGDPDDVFPLASVTKPIVAWSALVAVEQGVLDLDAPAGPEGSTVRHLLAHASGVPAAQGAPIAAPATRRIYSNYGFDLLGEAVERATSTPIHEWVATSIFVPLGMDSAEIHGSVAFGGRASLDSLARFAGELLAPSLISHDLAAAAFTPQFDGLSGVLPGFGRQKNNVWGLGLEIRGEKSPHWTGADFSPRTFGHFGQSGSFVWVDPQVNKAGVFLGAKPFGEEHVAIWPALTDQMRAA